ncbi:TPA: type IV conjugative transfer system pilin TraA [Aeromonas veronii]
MSNSNVAVRNANSLFFALMIIAIGFFCANHVEAADFLKAGAGTVKDSLGSGSTFSKWLILGEVIFGVVSYIKTKNLLLLAGVIVVVVFTTVGFGLAGL